MSQKPKTYPKSGLKGDEPCLRHSTVMTGDSATAKHLPPACCSEAEAERAKGGKRKAGY